MRAGLLDTNICLRHLAGDQPEQARKATLLFERIAVGEASATLLPTAFLEIVFVLERQYGASRQRVGSGLLELLHMPRLNVVDRQQLIDATHDYMARPSISFADAYHCAMARDFHDGMIVSFDRKLGGVPGVQRLEPDEV